MVEADERGYVYEHTSFPKIRPRHTKHTKEKSVVQMSDLASAVTPCTSRHFDLSKIKIISLCSIDRKMTYQQSGYADEGLLLSSSVGVD